MYVCECEPPTPCSFDFYGILWFFWSLIARGGPPGHAALFIYFLVQNTGHDLFSCKRPQTKNGTNTKLPDPFSMGTVLRFFRTPGTGWKTFCRARNAKHVKSWLGTKLLAFLHRPNQKLHMGNPRRYSLILVHSVTQFTPRSTRVFARNYKSEIR